MSSYIKVLAATATLTAAFISVARAEPTGAPTTLGVVRPYIGSNTVFVYPASPSPCDTTIYTIDISTPTGKAAYAAALAALVAGTRVQLEVVSCTGLYSPVQSILMLAN